MAELWEAECPTKQAAAITYRKMGKFPKKRKTNEGRKKKPRTKHVGVFAMFQVTLVPIRALCR